MKVVKLTVQDKADYGFRVMKGEREQVGMVLPSNVSRKERDDLDGAEFLASDLEVRSMEVRKIPASAGGKPARNVAAYCRVSTLFAEQESSIEGQYSHYEQLIRSNPEWKLVGIYLETGVTGTKAEIRPELQRMIRDCRNGKIDLILTKSVSRFARNTSDCLSMVRELTDLGVEIFFEKEQIKTGCMESEFMLSILACLAEEESHSISGNLKWGIRKRFEAGTYKQAHVPYGYQREGNALVIVPEEAAVVQWIFKAILAGRGMYGIAEEMNRRGICTRRGGSWQPSAVRQIVYNPVYIGDMLYQKTFMDESFHQRKNCGELEQFYEEDHHPAIICREARDLALAAVHQRGKECGTYPERENPRQAAKRRKRYSFSGRLVCAGCGRTLYRQKNRYYSVYSCPARQKRNDLCSALPEMEDNIKHAFITCLNKLAYSRLFCPAGRILDIYIRKLCVMGQKRREAPGADYSVFTERAKELKSFISRWTITGNSGDFPEAAFDTFIEKAIVDAGSSVTFYFTCGMHLTETLGRDVQ